MYILKLPSATCQGLVSQCSTGEMGFHFLQANHDWGRGAESQRAERHVHRDQCQDRLQCQTGDACRFPHISPYLEHLMRLCWWWWHRCSVNSRKHTTWPFRAHLPVRSSTKLSQCFPFSLFHKYMTDSVPTPQYSTVTAVIISMHCIKVLGNLIANFIISVLDAFLETSVCFCCIYSSCTWTLPASFSCSVVSLQPYLEWKAWMMRILKAVSFKTHSDSLCWHPSRQQDVPIYFWSLSHRKKCSPLFIYLFIWWRCESTAETASLSGDK